MLIHNGSLLDTKSIKLLPQLSQSNLIFRRLNNILCFWKIATKTHNLDYYNLYHFKTNIKRNYLYWFNNNKIHWGKTIIFCAIYYTFSCLVWCISLGQHIEENPTKKPQGTWKYLRITMQRHIKKFLPLVIVQYQHISLLSTHKDLIILQFKNTTSVFSPKIYIYFSRENLY